MIEDYIVERWFQELGNTFFNTAIDKEAEQEFFVILSAIVDTP